MDIEIRPIAVEEFDQFVTNLDRAFGDELRQEEIAMERRLFEPARSLAAFDDGRLVGSTGAFSLTLTVPGGSIPMPGVTAVGVQPTHRRRGLLTALMRRQLDDLHAEGEAIAGLWASEGAIYQRFGYGMATLVGRFEIDKDRTAFARTVEWPGQVMFADRARALEVMPGVHDLVVPQYPGMVRRTPGMWEHDFADLERWRDGASPLFFAIYEAHGRPEGYVAYRVKDEWPRGIARNEVRVRELMAASTEAYAALWRFCFDLDLAGKFEGWGRPADEPLLHLLAHPRALRFSLGDGLWLRMLDIPRALSARSYGAQGQLRLEVRDAFCPWNDGRYLLTATEDGDAACERDEGEPDLVVQAADVAAVYLGGTRFGTLHRAGRVQEVTAGALARADAMFAWDPPPWCPHVF
jgi:predicted acetyltransferase